jgi:hypothetical protein
MHGLFDLNDGICEAEFREALASFAEHLRDKRMLETWRLVRRQPHARFDTSTPPQYHVTMDFSDLQQADTAYAYVKSAATPVGSLHRAVHSKIREAKFAMYGDIA